MRSRRARISPKPQRLKAACLRFRKLWGRAGRGSGSHFYQNAQEYTSQRYHQNSQEKKGNIEEKFRAFSLVSGAQSLILWGGMQEKRRKTYGSVTARFIQGGTGEDLPFLRDICDGSFRRIRTLRGAQLISCQERKCHGWRFVFR